MNGFRGRPEEKASRFTRMMNLSSGLIFYPIFLFRNARREFWILYFLYALIPDFCEPALERLGLWRGDGLYKPEHSFCISAVHFLFSSQRFYLQHKGWYKLHPSFIDEFCKFDIPSFKSFEILRWVFRVRKCFDNIVYNKNHHSLLWNALRICFPSKRAILVFFIVFYSHVFQLYT